MTDNSDGLIRSALRGNEETAARLRRTQLVGVFALVAATLAVPVVRVVDEASDVDLQLNLWAAIQWLGEARENSGELPASFGWLGVVLYAGLVLVVLAPVLAVVLAVQRAGVARAAAVVVAALGAVVTLFCWLALVGETPERFADLSPTWGVLLPLALGLWTANMLETDS